MTCRCRHYRKLFIAAPLLFAITETLIYTVGSSFLGALLFGYWPLLAFQVGLFMRASHRKHGGPPAALTSRTPVFPGGHGCPAGSCPICGMEDPDYLEAWGHLQAHRACAELEGEPPPKPKERRPDYDDYLRRKTREQRRQAACLHRNVRPHGDGRTGACMDCYAIGELIKAEVPPPAGVVTLPDAWTAEQVEAFQAAWAAAAPDEQRGKSKIMVIQDREGRCHHERTQSVERWGAPTLRVCLDCGRGVGSRV